MTVVDIAIAAPISSTLSYAIDREKHCPGVNVDTLIGRRVLVPLGKRTVTGYIFDVKKENHHDFPLRAVKEILDDTPLFPSSLIPFFNWIASYYHYPIGEVISTALPGGLKRSSQKTIHLQNPDGPPALWPIKTTPEPPWYSILYHKKKLTPAQSRKILRDHANRDALKKLCDLGIVEIVDSVAPGATRQKVELCYTANVNINPDTEIDSENRDDITIYRKELQDRHQIELSFSEAKALFFHSKLGRDVSSEVPSKELLKVYSGAVKPLRSLTEKGILQRIKKRIYRTPFGEIPPVDKKNHQLTPEQKTAISSLCDAIDSRQFSPFLLHGVTGSGKTEVYLQVTEYCISKGLGVIVLVPEIALITQLESHFVAKFGRRVALLHSGLTPGEKYDQWTLAVTGTADIIIGARSAVFAPLKTPGLIIVDEEHDSSFKQDDRLRYNARDLAVLRGTIEKSVVLLGSATPSIVSYHNAVTGKYSLLSMNKRVPGSRLPSVKILDLTKRRRVKEKSVFLPEFLESIENTIQRGEQSLVLLNRRGFSSAYLCQDCGTSVQCVKCNISLTYHKTKNLLVCHYCGYTVGSNILCSECYSEKLIPFGVGTERIEEELQQNFPQARISRLDSDTAANKKRFFTILRAMHFGEVDILIGTQMIAKGHHFPNVTFVGVVWADGGLNMPDFRSAERTFQLLSQVTGRAGRGDREGRVLIQTMRPHHYALKYAQSQQYHDFYEKEISLRKRPAFPPFVRLLSFKISGDNEYDVRQTAKNVAAYSLSVKESKTLTFELLGPATSPLNKINEKFRWQILIKSNDTKVLNDISWMIMEQSSMLSKGKAEIILDRDPENMM